MLRRSRPQQWFRQHWFATAALSAALGASPLVAAAQGGGGDGYMFHTPKVSLSVRLGAAQPMATGRIYDFTSKLLTVDRVDYLGFSGAIDLDVMLTRRLALQFGTALSARNSPSSYRDFVDNNDKEIQQHTSLRRAPVTVGVKAYLTNPGRSVGRFAWVPSKLTPYVAAGGGGMYYFFRQSGDFIDFKTNDVFNTTLDSDGWAAMAYAAGGVNYSFASNMDLVTEARYEQSSAKLSSNFQGFGNINLSGLSMTAGLHLRF